ncbi:MAG: hypothetical protein HQ557_05560 [Bacteroidetes bacterium]|nr:hypothetical protein [Bacteroidota bacterium]
MVVEKSLSHAVRFNSEFPAVLHEKRKTLLGDIEYTISPLPHYLSGQIVKLMNTVD